MLLRQDVTNLYKYLLGREPESDAAISNMMRFNTLSDARVALLKSTEFVSEFENIQGIKNAQVVYQKAFAQGTLLKDGKNLIALATIVKNESSNVIKMLQSCVPIINYVIIVDTGSTDGTCSIAEAFLRGADVPYNIISIPFIDFANARNHAINLVPQFCQWLLMLDGDEHIVEEDYQDILNLVNTPGAMGWMLPRYNFEDFGKLKPVSKYPDYQQRLFRAGPGQNVFFTGAVHETLTGINSWHAAPANFVHIGGARGGPHIHHMGHCIAPVGSVRFDEKVKLYNSLSR